MQVPSFYFYRFECEFRIYTRGRKTIARFLREFIIWSRSRFRLIEYIIANLPKERTQVSLVFIKGVDCKGPQKSCVIILICSATKALWMELVTNIPTDSFLDAFKRFIATRGIPNCVWSDDVTNFVDAKIELNDLRDLFLSEDQCNLIDSYCHNNGSWYTNTLAFFYWQQFTGNA